MYNKKKKIMIKAYLNIKIGSTHAQNTYTESFVTKKTKLKKDGEQ